MKKLTAILINTLLVFSLAACSGNTNSDSDNSTLNSNSSVPVQTSDTNQTSDTAPVESDNKSTASSEAADPSEPADTTEKKTLVVYYSATGSTERIAGYIAAATDGDTMKLIPVNDYSSEDLNYNNSDSRVVYEHDNPDARDIELVKSTVDNWDEYDTVFIGYPIWWQIAAWPVDGFIKANDFTGKTVIPFCTSASSGLGDSVSLLEEMAGTGNWLEGQRFSSRDSEETVLTWVEGLKLD